MIVSFDRLSFDSRWFLVVAADATGRRERATGTGASRSRPEELPGSNGERKVQVTQSLLPCPANVSTEQRQKVEAVPSFAVPTLQQIKANLLRSR